MSLILAIAILSAFATFADIDRLPSGNDDF